MSKQKLKKISLSDLGGLVYSTDKEAMNIPNFEEETTIDKEEQLLVVRYETKHRSGKPVTLVENFEGAADDLEELGKSLKKYCGVGGSVKDGIIILQGNQKDKALNFLLKEGYKKTKFK